EDNPQQVSTCWRCHAPIEYLQVPQWFLKTLEFKKEVLKRADEIKWYPEFMKIRLQDWTNSLQWDWVLGRQRVFATPIPIWECKKCGHAICATKEMCYCDPTEDKPPVDKCPECGCTEFEGCTDVFDTWMDSSGSALYNTFWERDEEMHKKLYPMSMRPQSHDIIRTWAFYTILRSNQIKNEIPWKDIMIHGFIMAPDGTPMHTSIGNVIDPIPILEQYGADAMRYYAATCSLGIDHAFREKDVIRGRKLCNKVFNIGQFISRFIDGKPKECKDLRPSDRWIISRYSQTVKTVTEYLESYTFDKAMRDIENFIWHEFADHYVEMVKTRNDDAVKYTLYNVFLGSIKLLAPFMPHVTEDVYQEHFLKYEGVKSLHITEWPKPIFIDEEAEKEGDVLKDVIAAIRGWKSDKKIALNAELQLVQLIGDEAKIIESAKADIADTIKAKEVQFVAKADLTEDYTAVKPVHAKLGPAFKADAKAIVAELSKMDPKDVASALAKGSVKVNADGNDIELTSEYIELEKRLMLNGKAVDTLQIGNILIIIEQ
ncbi:MAG: class I tRNA ligase family protein, partial [Candidatus Methanomethylophilaceae archaeon]|nr:class I tRNA ligase family protein [Candidatus Methanomethylophilaceae archaeon]